VVIPATSDGDNGDFLSKQKKETQSLDSGDRLNNYEDPARQQLVTGVSKKRQLRED